MQDNLQQLVTVEFHGQPVLAIIRDGKPYVAMRPICHNLALDWDGQRQRIKRQPTLNKGAVMINAPSAGGEQSHLCLPLSMLNGWLFGVDVNRVREEIRPKLMCYQEECFDVLHQHFMGQQPTRFAVPGALYAKALQAERDEAASFAIASLAGKSLRQRRDEKKELAELLTMLREEVQLRLILGHIEAPTIANGGGK